MGHDSHFGAKLTGRRGTLVDTVARSAESARTSGLLLAASLLDAVRQALDAPGSLREPRG